MLPDSKKPGVIRWAVAIFVFVSVIFAASIWVTENRLSTVPGATRSLHTILVVFCVTLLAGMFEVIPGALQLPQDHRGWLGLLILCVCYTVGFSTLFITLPRLDMKRNAVIMNMEPVASLFLAWLILGQSFDWLQLVGGAVVLSCVVVLAISRA